MITGQPFAHRLAAQVFAPSGLPRVTFGRLALSVGVMLGVTLLRWLLRGVLGTDLPFVLFYPAVAGVTWSCGAFCGALSALWAGIAAWTLFVPDHSDARAVLRTLLFVAGCETIVWLTQWLQRARHALLMGAAQQIAQRRRFERMFDSIAEAVIVTDTDHTITFLNRAAAELTGWSQEAALGAPLLPMLVLKDTQTEQPIRALDELDRQEHGWLLAAPRRDAVPVAVSVAQLRQEEVSEGGTVLILRLAFDERERLRLTDEAQSARDDAQAAHRMKDDFLRMVSHELRAPLNAILGWTDVLQRKTDEATLKKACDTIRRSVRAQSALMDSMLDVAAIANGKFRIERQWIHLDQVIDEAHRAIEPIATTKHLSLRQEIDRTPLEVSADPARLQQLMANLYSNAIKFTPPGGSITTRLTYQDDTVSIEVQDSGQGMSQSALQLLFERSIEHEALRPSKTGLGLGLRISRHIIELHRGTLTALSAGEHQGTRLIVTLPRQADPPSADSEGEPSLELLHGLKVLVVDDDTQAALLLANVLEGLEAEVATADSARRGLDLYQRLQPAALISDLGMAYEDGYWLMAAIRRLEARDQRAPMVALAVTAYSRPEDRERSREAGFDHHLAKPISALHVASALAAVLARRPEGTQLNQPGAS